jgi:predicted amidohydrolase
MGSRKNILNFQGAMDEEAKPCYNEENVSICSEIDIRRTVMNAPIKIACIQISPFYRDTEENLKKAKRFLLEACDNGANLLVLPEIFNVGSPGKCREEAYLVSETIPEGQTSQMLMTLAKEKGVYICGSIIEREGVDLYNTSLLVGPDGLIGKFRKLHLCSHEAYYYEPGNLGIPVFRTPIGRIALLICMDTYYPETFRIAALQGADIVCASYAGADLQKSYGLPEGCHTLIPSLCMSNANANHIFVVGCNRVGTCNGYLSAGQSLIANPNGGVETPIAPHDEEIILYAEVDLSESRRKHVSSVNSRLANRRVDVYDATLGYDQSKYKQN